MAANSQLVGSVCDRISSVSKRYSLYLVFVSNNMRVRFDPFRTLDMNFCPLPLEVGIRNYLERILKEINNRNWNIRNTIEWKKFLHGE